MSISSAQNRRTLLKTAAILTLAGLAGCSTTSVLAPPGDGSDQTEATLGLINGLRKERGLSPLSRDPAAASAALSQAGRMAKAGKMAHLIGITDSFGGRMKSQSVALPAAENIAVGQADAQKAYLAWLNSPKHLVAVFAIVPHLLQAKGLFAFSVEDAEDRAGNSSAEGFVLRPSLRYAHTETYVRSLCETAGLEVLEVTRATIRKDGAQDVAGILFLSRKSL